MVMRYRAIDVDPMANERTPWEKREANAGLAATFAIPIGSVAQGGGFSENLRLGGKLLGGVGLASTYAAVAPATTTKNARIARNYVANARDYDAKAGAYGMKPQKVSSFSGTRASQFDLLLDTPALPSQMPDRLFWDKVSANKDVRVRAFRNKISTKVPGPAPGPGPGPNNAGSGRSFSNWLSNAMGSQKVTEEINPLTGGVESRKIIRESFSLPGALKTVGLLAAVPASAIGINALYQSSVKRKRARLEESAFENAMDRIENDPQFLKGDVGLMYRELGDQFRPVARQGFATVNRYAPTVAKDPSLAAEYMTRLMPETFGGMMPGDAYLARVEQLAKLENSLQKNEPSLASPLGSLFSSLL